MSMRDEKRLTQEDLQGKELALPDEVKPRKYYGQERARRTLKLAVSMDEPDWNVALLGPPESRKTALALEVAGEVAAGRDVPPDWVYVHNFAGDKDRPLPLSFPPGEAVTFEKRNRRMIKHLLAKVRLEARLMEETNKKVRVKIEAFNEKVKPYGLVARYIAIGGEMGDTPSPANARFELIYIENGRPRFFLSQYEQYKQSGQTMPANAQSPESQKVMEGFEKFGEAFRALDKEIETEVRSLRADIEDSDKMKQLKIDRIINPAFDSFKEKYPDNKPVREHLEAMRLHVIDNIGLFDLSEPRPQFQINPQEETVVCKHCDAVGVEKCMIHGENGEFQVYRVKIMNDNGGLTGAPVVLKTIHSVLDLFGRVDIQQGPYGQANWSHASIKPGALHEANGGFLILKISDTFATMNPAIANKFLVDMLKDRAISILGSPLDPVKIPLSVRVIFVGSNAQYEMLMGVDDLIGLSRVFKAEAQMMRDMPLTDENLVEFLGYVEDFCDSRFGKKPDQPAQKRVVDFARELTGYQNKLSLEVGKIIDLLQEADFYATKAGRDTIGREDVELAISEKRYRNGAFEELVHEKINEGTIYIATREKVVGQINALYVMGGRNFKFGAPGRITAVTSVGRKGVISIEREAETAGCSHNSGFCRLRGYLKKVFAQAAELSFDGSICFEQTHGRVDGDSASSTGLYAILSALSGFGISQDIAVTGAVGQHGDIQPIGGVNWKIAGFFDICQATPDGLIGTQGIMIPAANVKHLVLRPDIVAAVEAGKFHIYAVKTVEEGIEILTEMPFGSEDFDGDCIYKRVKTKLEEYAQAVGPDVDDAGGGAGCSGGSCGKKR